MISIRQITWVDIRAMPRGAWLTAILTGLVLVYLSLGARQSVPIESDGMRIALGVQSNELYQNHVYSYEYDEQAGTYELISVVSNILRMKPFDAFSLLTVLASISFLIATAFLLARILPSSFLVSFLSVLLFQEVYVSGYYPNSSMIAAAFLSIALLLATWKSRSILIALSGAIYAIAVWCRFDAIAVAFAFLVLLVVPNTHFIKYLSVFGIAFLGASAVLFLTSDVSPVAILQSYSSHSGHASDIHYTIHNYTAFFTLAALFMIAFGIYRLYRSKEWNLIGLTLLGTLPLLLAYGRSVTSPKYLLYSAIFLSIPVVYGIRILSDEFGLKGAFSLTALFVAVLISGQYVFTPPFELVLNTSTVVSTDDHVRLRGAIAYSPLYWAREKTQMLAFDAKYQDSLAEYIRAHSQAYIICHDWMANQWVLYYLQSQNYKVTRHDQYAEFLENGERAIMTKNQSLVYLVRWQPEKALDFPQSLKQEVSAMSSVLYIGPYSPYYEPPAFAQDSFLGRDFKYKQWDQWMRFRTIEFWR